MPKVKTRPKVIRVEYEEHPFIPPTTEFPISKDELISYYYENEMSIADIASVLGRGETTIRRWMDKYEIPRRSYSDATITYYKKIREKKDD
jgi:IS30 family transposase